MSIYKTITANEVGFACANCGTAIQNGDQILVCDDCGAIFCVECVENGAFENHDCDELDYY